MRPRSLFVSALSAAAVASMFYVLERRHSDWPVALCATLIMSPLFWLQSGLALTDMFGMVFVVGFLLVEGWALSLIGSLGQAFGPMHLTTSHIAATRPFTTSTISSRPSSLAKSAGSPG
jgi:hypothetical protein